MFGQMDEKVINVQSLTGTFLPCFPEWMGGKVVMKP